MSPLTDEIDSLTVLSRDGAGFSKKRASADQLQLVVFEGILPGPTEAVSIPEIAKFKNDHAVKEPL